MHALQSVVLAVLVAVASLTASAGPASAASVGPKDRQLTVRTSDGQALPATLRLPERPLPGNPAMVLVAGAGPSEPGDLVDEATAFTEAGGATLTYQKRTVGYSLTNRSYALLADDARAAADLMRKQPGIDADKVGYWGLSEGGWVAPIAAGRDARASFIVVVGANGIAPLRQASWAERIKLEHAGVRGSMVDAYAYTAYRMINGLGMFPESYYDPIPTLNELDLPLLGLWGDRDILTPPVESVTAYRAGLDAAGNRHYTLRTFAGAEHTLRRSDGGWDRSKEFAPGYVDLVTSWASQAASGDAPATSVAGEGTQPKETIPTPPLRWYESMPVQGAAFAIMILGFFGFWVIALVRRLRGRRGPRAPWSARLLTGTGLVAALGTPMYLMWFIMTGGTINESATGAGALLAGRPLVWLALQALAVFTVGAGIVTAVRHRPPAGDRYRIAVLLGTVVVFAGWALYWGLLRP